MRDLISEERVKKLHPKIRDEVKALIEKAEEGFPKNMAIRVVQGLRTIKEQNDLYFKGRDKNGKIVNKKLVVTNARGGRSFHNPGLAVDFAILHDKDNNGNYEELSWDAALDFDKDGTIDWQEVVKVFKDAGYEWGGDWRTIIDRPHIQKTFGYTWQQLLAKHNKKEFIPGTSYVVI
jgi:peptidoglycan LD-endopeptidase CwlK